MSFSNYKNYDKLMFYKNSGMKNIATLLLLFSITVVSRAQQSDKVLARVTYYFTHIRNLKNRYNPYTEKMLLVVGKNSSVYTSLSRIERDLHMPVAKVSPDAPFKVLNNEDLYHFTKENKAITRQRFMNEFYLIDEVNEDINWRITKSTSTIGGIKCKKALAHFKGRNWVAWFAPELPFKSGPWKLNGLPGLIIEAFDETYEIQFLFGRIDILDKSKLSKKEVLALKTYQESMFFDENIIIQTDALRTNRANFDKKYKLYLKDPIAYISAETGIPKNKILNGTSPTGFTDNIINNPIELPEMKLW